MPECARRRLPGSSGVRDLGPMIRVIGSVSLFRSDYWPGQARGRPRAFSRSAAPSQSSPVTRSRNVTSCSGAAFPPNTLVVALPLHLPGGGSWVAAAAAFIRTASNARLLMELRFRRLSRRQIRAESRAGGAIDRTYLRRLTPLPVRASDVAFLTVTDRSQVLQTFRALSSLRGTHFRGILC